MLSQVRNKLLGAGPSLRNSASSAAQSLVATSEIHTCAPGAARRISTPAATMSARRHTRDMQIAARAPSASKCADGHARHPGDGCRGMICFYQRALLLTSSDGAVSQNLYKIDLWRWVCERRGEK